VKNSGHREAVITFFCFEKVSISLNIPAARQALRFKYRICIEKGFLVKHRLLDAAAR
jgi:hypothetical protein